MPLSSVAKNQSQKTSLWILPMLFAVSVLSGMGVIFLLWQLKSNNDVFQQEQDIQRALAQEANHVIFTNEILTNATRLRALTGDSLWKTEYTSSKNDMIGHITDIKALSPSILSELVQDIENVILRILTIEESSFLLMENNYPQEGLDLLQSPEYKENKQRLTNHLNRLKQAIDSRTLSIDANRRHEIYRLATTLAGLLTLTFCMWLFGLRLLHRWQKQLINENTARQQAEHQLHQQSAFLDTIIQHLPVAVVAKDIKNNYTFTLWNKKAEELFEWPTENVIGTRLHDYLPKQKADEYTLIDKKAVHTRSVVEIEALPVHSPRGDWLAHFIKVPIFDEKDQPHLLLEIIEDITVRKQNADSMLQQYATELETKNKELDNARHQAIAADRAKSEFLATMSHEIRTPLNGIIGTTDLLNRTNLSHQQSDFVQTIRKSGENLLYVINDILDLTKLEAHQLSLELIPLNFPETIEDVIEIHSANANKKEIEFLFRYAPGTPCRFIGDPVRLRQILNNLISNALKFTEFGHIIIDVEQIPADETKNIPTLKVSIHDTGIGIAEENLNRLFKRFSQAEASTTRRFGGSGLGLAICKQLINLMGGEIHVTSTLGQGSTFWFTLPIQVDNDSNLEEQINAITNWKESIKGSRVLIVDNNPASISILEEYLKSWNCLSYSANSGNEILDWLSKYESTTQPFDIALITQDLPDMPGVTIAEALRAHPLTHTIPLVVFTPRGTATDTHYFAEKGFNAYLSKPTPPTDILRIMATLHNPNYISHGEILSRHALKQTPTDSSLIENVSFPINVLVVEDDPVNQKVIQLMLEGLQSTIHVAMSGVLGFEAFKIGQFDLVLMDMQMPEMDGPAATRLIRAWEEENHRPRTTIIALTANAMAEHQKLCLEAGMDDYMTKPITRNKLIEQLARHIQPVTSQTAPTTNTSTPPTPPDEELKSIFAQSAKECLAELEESALFDDKARWKRAAHRLKGAAATMGYEEVRQLSAQAEDEFATLNLENTVQALTTILSPYLNKTNA